MVRIAAGVVVLMALLLMVRLAVLQREGPHHGDTFIRGNIPATIYLPGEADPDGEFPFQKAKGERPPVVVIAHGYSFDRNIMSPMARSLADAGFAVVTFDFRGHGDNTQAFQGDLVDDFDAVVDWAQRSPHVDGERIAILGHSMGAGAALEFGTLDDRPLAVIPVSGGFEVYDAVVPRNLLLLVAENDPDRIHDSQDDIVEYLGDTTNVRKVEIGGTDHGTILWSGDTVDAIVDFLNPVFGTDAVSPGIDDPRLRAAVAYVFVVVLLLGFLGLLAGRFAQTATVNVNWGGFLLLGGAMVIAMPLMASGGPQFFPLGAGQAVVASLAVAGGLLWAVRALAIQGVLTGRLASWAGVQDGLPDRPWLPLRAAIGPGLTAGVVVMLLLLPIAVVFHRMIPTTERLIYWVVLSALALPFFAAYEGIVRRGGTWQAIGLGLLGRVILLVLMMVGVMLGVLPFVISLVLPALVLQYVMIEVFASTTYLMGRNPAVVAVMSSVFVAYIAVTITPIG